jgi:surface polysaccharide O-acyltransferase-like enzyme
MLLVGYLQEIGLVSLLFSTITGFGFLDYSFYQLYQYVGDIESKQLFWFMFIIWSLYGFAAMTKNKFKNTMYNLLDVISKNFYGIFIAYKLII